MFAGLTALALACGEGDGGAESQALLSASARPDVVERLLAGRAARRHPSDGGGRSWIALGHPSRPLTAGRPVRLPIAYEAGPLGIAEGGSLSLLVPPNWGWSDPQVANPAAPGFVEVSTRAPGVVLERRIAGQNQVDVAVRGRALAAGERIEIVYGAGSKGARADRFAERRAPVHLGVDGDGDGVHAFLPEPATVDVRAGAPARLVATLPSTARPGAAVTLRLAWLDAAGNAGVDAEGAVLLEGDGPVELPAGVRLAPADAGVLALQVRPLRPGIARIRARWNGLAAESNPLHVEATGPRLLWADLHGHSHSSDGTGTPEDYFRYARDVSGLDVAALTDHDHWGVPFLDESPRLWAEIERATARFHEPGRFVTLLGYEWTSWLYGHRHVLFFDDRARIRSSLDEESDDPAELWASLRGTAAFTVPHHPAGGAIALDWGFAPDPELEPVVEIVSAHGSSEAPDAPLSIYDAVPGRYVRDALAKGYRLGFVGSGDSHDGHPGLVQLAGLSGGLAALSADDLTRQSVREALRERRCYATNGPRIVLRATLAGRPMGALVPPGDATARVRISAVAQLERIELVRGASVAIERRIDREDARRDIELEAGLEELRPGEAIYVRVVQVDGGAAWGSPWFVDGGAPRSP